MQIKERNKATQEKDFFVYIKWAQFSSSVSSTRTDQELLKNSESTFLDDSE